MVIVEGGLEDPRVIELLDAHLTRGHAYGPRGAPSLGLSELRMPDIVFWSAWSDASRTTVIAIGALKTLMPTHGEVKSMYVADAMRGRGYGTGMIRHIITTARSRQLERLSLATGSHPYFAAARAPYARHGFIECEPFAHYHPDPDGVFMTLVLH